MRGRLKKWLITGLGTGYLPIAPGTWASGAVAAIFVLTALGSGGRWYCVGGTMFVLAALASTACLRLGGFAESAFGRKDPHECTADEWAGQAVTYLLLPTVLPVGDLFIVAGAGFLAFRLFDILKPPPARGIQKLRAGAGILADDLIAGVYANVLCQIIFRVVLQW